MLDRDLAVLYDVKNTRLREQVKRNIHKFPEHFMFRLTEAETDFMVSQNAIPSKDTWAALCLMCLRSMVFCNLRTFSPETGPLK